MARRLQLSPSRLFSRGQRSAPRISLTKCEEVNGKDVSTVSVLTGWSVRGWQCECDPCSGGYSMVRRGSSGELPGVSPSVCPPAVASVPGIAHQLDAARKRVSTGCGLPRLSPGIPIDPMSSGQNPSWEERPITGHDDGLEG